MILEASKTLEMEGGMKFPDCNRVRREHMWINIQFMLQHPSMLSGDVPKLQYEQKKKQHCSQKLTASVFEHNFKPTLFIQLNSLQLYLVTTERKLLILLFCRQISWTQLLI